MTEAHSYWIREFDVDGYRVDAIWGVRQRRPDYAPLLRQELKRIKPDSLLIAEAGARDDYYFTHGYDAAYDWTDELGHWAWENVFEDPDQIVPRLHQALTNEGRGFHADALIFRFLNNNDTGPRFITRYGPDLTRVAAAMLLTLPGLPCIYTGQEVGAEYEPYRTNEAISWEDAQGLRDYYKQLISLRKNTPALHSRRWDIVPAESSRQVYAYCRYADGAESVLVVLNFSPRSAAAKLDLPSQAQSFAGRSPLTDLLCGEPVSPKASGKGSIEVDLPASTAYVLVAR
jgi:glycosidase